MLTGSDGPALEAVRVGCRSDRYFQAFEHAPLAMALVGTDDRILHANVALSRLSGYRREQLAVLTMGELTHPDDRDRAAAARASVVWGQAPSSTAEARMLRPDGKAILASISCSATADGGPTGRQLVVHLVDVTRRSQAEQELSRSNADLSSFAYLAAHELKSPLQSLAGFTALLDRAHGAELDPQAREFLGWIADGAGRMDSLIDALLAYCMVDRSEAVLAPVDLEAALGEALDLMWGEVSGRGAVVNAGPLPVVTGDPVQLGQLLQNLLANALKFVPDGRPPQIHVSAERAGKGWTVTVADNGIGVADADRERIFTMFSRLHPRERYKGTGIGLAVCKRIVERRGGTIWVEPNARCGSRFRFHLPDAAALPSTVPGA